MTAPDRQAEQASAIFRDGAIVVSVPAALRTTFKSAALRVPSQLLKEGYWQFPATRHALKAIKQCLGPAVTLDRHLRNVWVDINKREIERKRIVGEPPRPILRAVYVSPLRGVFHRPDCDWA